MTTEVLTYKHEADSVIQMEREEIKKFKKMAGQLSYELLNLKDQIKES